MKRDELGEHPGGDAGSPGAPGAVPARACACVSSEQKFLRDRAHAMSRSGNGPDGSRVYPA